MSELPIAEAAERNKGPLLEVLRFELRDRRSVLEIGSGTGQHAIHFAAAMPHLVWQTSDLAEHHPGIMGWIERTQVRNVRAPLCLDVSAPPEIDAAFDAVFTANTCHIMSLSQVEQMFALVGAALDTGGRFIVYGPFNDRGAFSSASNARFDAGLRARDPAMGIRDLLDLDRFAANSGMCRLRRYAMPANNLVVVWTRTRAGTTALKHDRQRRDG